MRWALIAAALCGVPGCYEAHERPSVADAEPPDTRVVVDASLDASAAADGAVVDSSLDAVVPDTGPCDGRTSLWTGPCDPAIEAACQARATMQARGRYAYSRCHTLPGGAQSECSVGDWCGDGTPCRCTATRSCAGDDVCVSDTPDGVHYCIPICTRR